MIFFFFIGLAIIGLGIFAKKHSNNMYKLGITYARVQDCQPATKTFGEMEIPCTQLTLEVPTAYGVVCKTVLDNGNYQVGDTVEIFYDATTDKIEFRKNVSEKGNKGPYILMAFGAFICLILLMTGLGSIFPTVSYTMTQILSYFVALALLLGGLYLGILKPQRRKRAMSDCHTVPGVQVDYKRNRDMYTPIYEFYHNGEMLRIEGESSNNGSRYRNKGRRVTIVINDVTGEKYCLDDVSGIQKTAIILTLFGAVVLAILVARDFFGYFGGSTFPSASSVQLTLNENGYSTEHPEMPKDEEYCEYYYTPASTNDSFAYNIRVYQCGVGVVTIFPMESQGKGIQQIYSFYTDSAALKQITKAGRNYDFDQLAESKTSSSEGEGNLDHEYLYYYDGSERIGSGGYGVKGDDFDAMAESLKTAVPQEVWDAVKKEIWGYYE